MNEDINFAEVFSNETFEGLKNAVIAYLKKMGGMSNASLEYEDKHVYLHAHKDAVEIHIVSGNMSEKPLLPEEDDNKVLFDEDE